MVRLTSSIQTIGDAGYGSTEFKEMLTAVGGISSEKVEMVKDVVNTAKEYYASSPDYAASKDANTPAEPEGAQKVVINLDSREIAEAILPYTKKRLVADLLQRNLYSKPV